MLKTKTILTNVLKSLVIASMALGTATTMAGQDHYEEKGEKKIGELKDMKTKAKTMKAEEVVENLDVDTTLDAQAAKAAMKDEAAQIIEEEVGEIADVADQVMDAVEE